MVTTLACSASAWKSEILALTEGEWINEFERQSLNRRNPPVLEPQLVKNVLAANDCPCINPLAYNRVTFNSVTR